MQLNTKVKRRLPAALKILLWKIFGRPYHLRDRKDYYRYCNDQTPFKYGYCIQVGCYVVNQSAYLERNLTWEDNPVPMTFNTEQSAHDWAIENLNLWGRLYE